MKCRNAYIAPGGHAYGCGQCVPCRINRRRVWQHRIMLESLQHSDNAFVTLTYNDDKIPAGDTLVPKDAQDWLKRLRYNTDLKLRYYLVGEYGDQTMRPHYHAILFGFPSCFRGNTRLSKTGKPCCAACTEIQKSWSIDNEPLGHILVGQVTLDSAQYVANYTTKKMTKPDDERLEGRHPEFARMSLRPGIGYSAMHEVADKVLQWVDQNEDVPTSLTHGRKPMPLGRYLTRTLREMSGRDKNAPLDTVLKVQEEMQPMRDRVKEMAGHLPLSIQNHLLTEAIRVSNDQAFQNQQARARIFRQRRSL